MPKPEASRRMISPCCEIIQTARLPLFGDEIPDPLNTIAQDSAGNIYASVEFSHAVLSFDPQGSLRWLKAGKGDSVSAFHYPKGIAIGWIESAGSRRQCLAVADSWNRRVQLFDLEGEPLGAWTEINGTRLVDPVDIRFIQGGGPSAGQHVTLGTGWLILDKGNHRLYGIRPDGAPLFGIGRGFPASLEANWSVPGAFFAVQDAADRYFDKYCPAYDFIWYPERILGNAAGNLFVYEPQRRRLKQVHFPHLLPVAFSAGVNEDWISADTSALLAFDPTNDRLIRYDCASGSMDFIHPNGRHVYSAGPASEFWVQKCDQITKYRLAPPASAGYEHDPAYLLRRSAEIEKSRLDPAVIQAAVEYCLNTVREEVEFAEKILAQDQAQPPGELIEGVSAEIGAFRNSIQKADARLHQVFHHWCVGDLIHSVLNAQERTFSDTPEITRLRQSTLVQVQVLVARINQCLERCALIKENGWRSVEHESPFWGKAVRMVGDDLPAIHGWLMYWSGMATWPRN